MTKPSIRIAALAALTMITSGVYAESPDECSIWLCLPGGFPSGCGAAHSAMIGRIKDRKPPLPAFGSCAVNPPAGSGSHMTFSEGVAAFVPTHDECKQWAYSNDQQEQQCLSWVTIPEHHVKGILCQSNENTTNPPFCTTTRRWAEVYTDGALAGPTYYW